MDKVKLLFVCLGNICRSPAAEGVMKRKVEEAGLTQQFEIDSAGTSGYHAGDAADARMRRHARNRGLNLTSISRQVQRHDFDYFDWIIAMDDSNYDDLLSLARTQEHRQKVVKMADFCSMPDVDHVPDPYYGGDAGFERVLDILDDACNGLLQSLRHA
jgi:protein-tyrosine phosphatase